MGLETATYISQLTATNPTSSDPVSQGDDHLRLIKSVLQSQFTTLGAAAVTTTAAELNLLDGKELWSFNVGSGNRSGIISYLAKGEQFILFPIGCCGMVPALFMPSIDERFKNINVGAMLVAFKLVK